MNTLADEPLSNRSIEAWQFRLHCAVIPFVILVMVAGPLYLGYLVTWSSHADSKFIGFVLDNYLVFFVLPYVGLFAYFIVTTLRMSNGPVGVRTRDVHPDQGRGGPDPVLDHHVRRDQRDDQGVLEGLALSARRA